MKVKTISGKDFEVSNENLRRISEGTFDVCRFLKCEFCKYGDIKNKKCNYSKNNKDTYLGIEELAYLLQRAASIRKRCKEEI